jgi:DNA-binding beta-propeller fold protein YncE
MVGDAMFLERLCAARSRFAGLHACRTTTVVIVAALACFVVASARGQTASAQRHDGVPAFQLDASWPKPLPNQWILWPISGVAVDSQDHVWVLHRPSVQGRGGKAAAKSGTPAPPIIEFDLQGNVLRAWGGPGEGYEWPIQEHGLRVDYKGNVWVSGAASDDFGKILKFSPEGKFLLQIGKLGSPSQKLLNNDHLLLGKLPADMYVDPGTNELFVADGERGGRRVIVFDAGTGSFKRLWGAYGEKPDEGPVANYDPAAAISRTFSGAVHCVQIANDGLVYVCDRGNDRIQVFHKDGKFMTEAVIEKQTVGAGSAAGIAFSPDQKYLYLADGVNQKTWILQRASLEIVGSFQVSHNLHAISVDSKGNIYTAEVAGERPEKFTLLNQ